MGEIIRFLVVDALLISSGIGLHLVAADAQEGLPESFSLDVLDGHFVDLFLERFLQGLLLGGEGSEVRLLESRSHVGSYILKYRAVIAHQGLAVREYHLKRFLRYSLMRGLKTFMSYSNHIIIG